jgi:hypothetical protein
MEQQVRVALRADYDASGPDRSRPFVRFDAQCGIRHSIDDRCVGHEQPRGDVSIAAVRKHSLPAIRRISAIVLSFG